MLADPDKVENFVALQQLLQQQLYWINAKIYSREPQYHAFVQIVQNIARLDDSHEEMQSQLREKLSMITDHIIDKFKTTITLFIDWIHKVTHQIDQLDRQIHKEKQKCEELEEISQNHIKKIAHLELQYESLKVQKSQMESKYEKQLKRIKRQRKQIRRTFLQVREFTEQGQLLLQNEKSEKLQIKQKMEQQKRTKDALLLEIQQMKGIVEANVKELNASAKKLTYEEKRIARLQQQLAQKIKIIAQLQEQKEREQMNIQIKETNQMLVLEQGNNTDRHHNEELNSNTETTQKRLSFIAHFNLGQEMELRQDYEISNREINGSVRGSIISMASQQQNFKINSSVIKEEESQKSPSEFKDSRQIVIPDFYFAHYQLLVQAVKLKMGRQQLFDIQLNNFYHEMINEGVAFHEWDQWIAKKLPTVLNQRR